MKKVNILFIAALILFCLFSCSKAEEKKTPEMTNLELANVDNIQIYENQIYEPTGIVVYAVYDDGKKYVVTAASSFSQLDTSSVGDKEVTVTYQSFEAKYTVHVLPQEIKNIYTMEIETLPIKTIYELGENLDLSGLVLRVYLNSEPFSRFDSNSCQVLLKHLGTIKKALDEVGDYEVILSTDFYGDLLTVNFFIEVIQDGNVLEEKFIVQTPANKLEYYVGEALDFDGLVVGIEDAIGNSFVPIPISECDIVLRWGDITKEALDEEGEYIVYIRYATLACFYSIDVVHHDPLKSLVLNYENAKIQYSLGEAFSSAGLDIRYYEDGVLKRIVSAVNCQFKFSFHGIYKESLDEPGTYTVIVEFEDLVAEYKIYVI